MQNLGFKPCPLQSMSVESVMFDQNVRAQSEQLPLSVQSAHLTSLSIEFLDTVLASSLPTVVTMTRHSAAVHREYAIESQLSYKPLTLWMLPPPAPTKWQQLPAQPCGKRA